MNKTLGLQSRNYHTQVGLFPMTIRKFIILGLTLFLSMVSYNSYAIPEKKFKNCTALNKEYPGGVAEKATSVNKNKAGVPQDSRNVPKVSSKIYKENKGLDRDKDGIACEV